MGEGFARTAFAAKLVKNNNESRQLGRPQMNATMEMDHAAVMRVKLEVLRREHRDLDDAIAAMHERGTGDQLAMKRLKKRKLGLKDAIARIEDELMPDIIA